MMEQYTVTGFLYIKPGFYLVGITGTPPPSRMIGKMLMFSNGNSAVVFAENHGPEIMIKDPDLKEPVTTLQGHWVKVHGNRHRSIIRGCRKGSAVFVTANCHYD